MDYTYEELLQSCRQELIAIRDYCKTMTVKCSDPEAIGDYFKGFNAGLEIVARHIDETIEYL